MTTMTTITPAFFKLTRNRFGRLVLTDAQGVHHEGVVPVRAHPISAPNEGISLVGTDGHELAWVDDLAQLPDTPRQLLTEELASRDFYPTFSVSKPSQHFPPLAAGMW